MIGTFLRQWRRILLSTLAFMAFVAVGRALGYPGMEGLTGGPVLIVVSVFLACLIVVTGATLVLSVLMPTLLPLVERTGVALILATPAGPVLAAWGWPGWTQCVVLFVAIQAVSYAVAGGWQARLARPGRPRTGSFTTRLPMAEVRRRLIPHPADAASYYWAGTSFAEAPDGSDADFVMTRPRRGALPDAVDAVRIREEVPGRLWSWEAVPVDGGAAPAVRTTVGIAPTARGTRVTVCEQVFSAPPGMLLHWWLSGDFRDHLASMKARLAGRRDVSIHGRQMVRRPRDVPPRDGTRPPAGTLQPG